MKPRVLLAVLCGRERDMWINPALFQSLLRLKDDRFDVTVELAYDLKPHELPRNVCVMNARNQGYDFLVQIDNDMVLPGNFRDVLHETIVSGKPVVGLRAASIKPDGRLVLLSGQENMPWEGNFRRTGLVGAGVLIISAEVWRKIPTGPWFRWIVEGELSICKISEDYYFCEMLQQRGFEIWTHRQAVGHLKTCDLTQLIADKEDFIYGYDCLDAESVL